MAAVWIDQKLGGGDLVDQAFLVVGRGDGVAAAADDKQRGGDSPAASFRGVPRPWLVPRRRWRRRSGRGRWPLSARAARPSPGRSGTVRPGRRRPEPFLVGGGAGGVVAAEAHAEESDVAAIDIGASGQVVDGGGGDLFVGRLDGRSNAASPWPGPSIASVASPRARKYSAVACSSSLVESRPGTMITTGGAACALVAAKGDGDAQVGGQLGRLIGDAHELGGRGQRGGTPR